MSNPAVGLRNLAVIPARGGSKGVPGKNIRLLGGKPLLVYTVEAAKRSGMFANIVVSTDDPRIRDIALAAGAEAPFVRPPELATDGALAIPTIQHSVREMEARTGSPYEYIAMLQPTTPLRSAEDLVTAMTRLRDEGADGIISVVDVDNWHPRKMKKFSDGLLLDYEPSLGENPPRQSLPKVYMVNGALYATRRDVLMNNNSFKGSRCLGHEMPVERSANIDTEADFLLADYYLRRQTG